MRIELEGKTALVTGSTAGIGRAIAHGLAAASATVVVNGRNQERAEAVATEIGEEVGDPSRIRGVGADVGDAEGAGRLIEAVPDLDILVNNAGIFELKPFFEIPRPGPRASTRCSPAPTTSSKRDAISSRSTGPPPCSAARPGPRRLPTWSSTSPPSRRVLDDRCRPPRRRRRHPGDSLSTNQRKEI